MIPILSSLCGWTAKLSILCLYYRVFSENRQLRMTVIILHIFYTGWVITAVALFIFRCLPIETSWDPSVSGNCIDLVSILVGTSVPLIISDLTLVILPIKVIRNLQLPSQTKLGICFIFALGSL